MEEIRRELQKLGRGMAQLTLRVNRLGESSDAPAASASGLEMVFDLLDSIEQSLAQPAPVRRWWSMGRPPTDLTGLRLVRDHVHERLLAQGIEPASTRGPVDPTVHRVIDVAAATAEHGPSTIRTTHTLGWIRTTPSRSVLRYAQVTATKAEP